MCEVTSDSVSHIYFVIIIIIIIDYLVFFGAV